MLVLFSLILLVIGAALIGGIYAIFTPFIDQLGSIQHYNMAYYGAISSLERSQLVLRGHQPGFEGKGGWGVDGSGNTFDIGPDSDYFESDGATSRHYWGLMSVGDNGQKWEIKSMIPSGSTTVPFSGQGNVDPDMATGNSFNFNKLEFGTPIQIALYRDGTSNSSEYYQIVPSGNINDIDTSDLKVYMRVPPKILGTFNGGTSLNYLQSLNNNSIDLDGDGINNDSVAIRSLFGIDDSTKDFSILPSIDVDYVLGQVDGKDSSIREDIINGYDDSENNANLSFDASLNPVIGGDNPDNLYLVPSNASNLSGENLTNILDGTLGTTRMHMKLSLANILRYNNDNIYPYLEVKIDAGIEIPDLFYHITAQSAIGKYNVKLRVDKPIFETSEAGDYVILF